MPNIAVAHDIHAMLQNLQPADPQQDGTYQIAFEVGKLGSIDRFVLRLVTPSLRREVCELCTQPEEGTAAVLQILDDLTETDPNFGSSTITHASPRMLIACGFA